jgi:hypothetical protein
MTRLDPAVMTARRVSTVECGTFGAKQRDVSSSGDPLAVEEFRALGATIRQRGSLRFLVTTITFSAWATVSITVGSVTNASTFAPDSCGSFVGLANLNQAAAMQVRPRQSLSAPEYDSEA